MAAIEVPIRLYRDSTGLPWGFRLQGGLDGSPLNIQRVFAGGVADGHLNRGDQLVTIDNRDVRHLSLQDAENLVGEASRELLLLVKRVPVHHSPQLHSDIQSTHVSNYPFEFQSGFLEDYDHARNLPELREKFSHTPEEAGLEEHLRGKVQINARPGTTSYVPKKISMFSKPQQHALEFGWSPKTHASNPTYVSQRKLIEREKSPSVRQVLSSSDQLPSYNQPHIHHESYEKPAWLGSLKSSGGLKPWEIQEGFNIMGGVPSYPHHHAEATNFDQSFVQNDNAISAVYQPKVQVTKFSPGSITYEQHSADTADHSDTARIKHAQYNSPLGLYSAANAKQVLNLQTADKPGSGTLKIVEHTSQASKPYSPVHSDVYRLVREEEEARRAKRRGHNQQITQQQPLQSAFSHYEQHAPGVSDF